MEIAVDGIDKLFEIITNSFNNPDCSNENFDRIL